MDAATRDTKNEELHHDIRRMLPSDYRLPTMLESTEGPPVMITLLAVHYLLLIRCPNLRRLTLHGSCEMDGASRKLLHLLGKALVEKSSTEGSNGRCDELKEIVIENNGGRLHDNSTCGRDFLHKILALPSLWVFRGTLVQDGHLSVLGFQHYLTESCGVHCHIASLC